MKTHNLCGDCLKTENCAHEKRSLDLLEKALLQDLKIERNTSISSIATSDRNSIRQQNEIRSGQGAESLAKVLRIVEQEFSDLKGYLIGLMQ